MPPPGGLIQTPGTCCRSCWPPRGKFLRVTQRGPDMSYNAERGTTTPPGPLGFGVNHALY